jgi:hypothetical protein
MPAPAPLTGSILKVTQIFGGGKWGWSESYYLSVLPNDNTVDLSDGFGFVNELNPLRRTILAKDYNLEATRIEIVFGINKGQSELFEAPSLGAGAGLYNTGASAVDAPAPVWLAYWGRDHDISADIGANRNFRGLPVGLTAGWTNAQVGIIGGLPIEVAAFEARMSLLLGTQRLSVLGHSVTPCIGGFDRVVAKASYAVLPPNPLTASASGQLIVKQSPIGTLGVRGLLKLHIDRMKCVKGVSGTFRVIDIDAVHSPPYVYYTLAKQVCCDVTNLVGATGWTEQVLPAWYAYPPFNPNSSNKAMNIYKLAKKDTGRPFFGTVGHAKSRCC